SSDHRQRGVPFRPHELGFARAPAGDGREREVVDGDRPPLLEAGLREPEIGAGVVAEERGLVIGATGGAGASAGQDEDGGESGPDDGPAATAPLPTIPPLPGGQNR